MGFSVDVLAKIAIELQKDVDHQDRFQRLVTTLRQVLNCDAAALLRYEPHQFILLAVDGLTPDVLGHRFLLEGHPRLETIAQAGDVVRFPADSDLPNPYDGLIPDREHLKVYACVGLPLFAGQNLIGTLTLDGMDPNQFDTFSDEELRLIGALTSGALNNALLIEQLEKKNMLFTPTNTFKPTVKTEIIAPSEMNILARAGNKTDSLILQVSHFALGAENPVHSGSQTLSSKEKNLKEATDEFQRDLIKQALLRNNQNWAASARELSLDPANLRRLTKRLGLKS